MDIHKRSGNIAMLVAFGLVAVLGIGALAVDTAYLRLAQSQTQDIADAASQAAVFTMRQTGDVDQATAAAQAACDLNLVAGQHPSLDSIEFGIWDDTVEPGVFTPSEDAPNAVSIVVSRSGDDAVPFLIGRVFGQDFADVRAHATSAARSLHVCLAMDITNSWSRPNFHNARDASVAFLDTMTGSYGDSDRIGMSIFTGRYGWEFTPLTLIRDEVGTHAIRAQWADMETASKAGKPLAYPKKCSIYRASSGKQDDFTDPAGGCFPDMPREYSDEPGTDHTTGISMCETMFTDQTDPAAYRAMVVLTDGKPNGIYSGHGDKRIAQGYSESRWREYVGPVPHSTSAIQSDSVAITDRLWQDQRVHTWVISFVKDATFMHQMPQGDGYFVLTSRSAELVNIFEEIANSLPIAIVE